MKKLIAVSILSAFAFGTAAAADGVEVIQLWPNGAPNKSAITEPETVKNGAIFNVTEARLEVTRPSNPNGKAVILIPGGGYGNLSMPTIEPESRVMAA